MRSDKTLPTFIEQARREQIVAAASQVIAAAGYAQASLARIAEHAGIAKSVVLYHFKTKNDVIDAVVSAVFTAAAAQMVPALNAVSAPPERLATYIRSNAMFIDHNRVAAVAMVEIVTGYRSPDGRRLDQVASPPPSDPGLAALDPESIFADGVSTGHFRRLSPPFLKNALRAALDGAAWELARDPDFDVLAYAEELVTVFDLATRSQT